MITLNRNDALSSNEPSKYDQSDHDHLDHHPPTVLILSPTPHAKGVDILGDMFRISPELPTKLNGSCAPGVPFPTWATADFTPFAGPDTEGTGEGHAAKGSEPARMKPS